jgi:hypothetical protein
MKEAGLNWDNAQGVLDDNFEMFESIYNDAATNTNRKSFDFFQAKFSNKYGQEKTGWIKFQYEVGHRLHSNYPQCYQGMYM